MGVMTHNRWKTIAVGMGRSKRFAICALRSPHRCRELGGTTPTRSGHTCTLLDWSVPMSNLSHPRPLR